MVTKKDPTSVLVTVVKALGQLGDDEKRWVLQSAASRWGFGNAVPSLTPGGSHPPTPPSNPANPANVKDAKGFMTMRDPQSDLQRIAALAYYLTHGKNTGTFKTQDLTKANREAKGPNFNLRRAVGNAARTKCGYLSPVGGGKKQLSAYGEQIVEALPDQTAVQALEAKYKKRKRRAGIKKTSAKKT